MNGFRTAAEEVSRVCFYRWEGRAGHAHPPPAGPGRGLVALSGDNVEENVLTIILQLTFPNLASGDPGPALHTPHTTQTDTRSVTINGNHE